MLNRRDNRGMSVVTILSMSLIISIFLAALYEGILPVYRKVAGLRYANSLRTANEAAIDYLMDRVNNGTLPLTMATGATMSPTVPTSVTTQGGTQPNVSVAVTNLGNAPGAGGVAPNCVLYDRNRKVQYNFMRMTSVCSLGSAKKTLTVLLEPIPVPTSNPLFASFGAWGTTAVQFVGRAGIGGYNLPTIAGQPWKNPYQFADIGSNGAGNQVVARNSHSAIVEAGHQFEFPTTAGQFNTAVTHTQNQFNAQAATGLTNIDIMGNLYSNANDDGFTQNGGYFSRDQNNMTAANQNAATVFGASNGMAPVFDPVPGQTMPSTPQYTPSGIEQGSNPYSKPIPTWSNTAAVNNNIQGTASAPAGGNPGWGNPGAGAGGPALVAPGNPYTGGYIDSNSGFAQPNIPPAPGAPPGTVNLGTAIVNGTLKIVDGAAPVTSINVPSGQTLNIPPGNYQMTQLNVGASGKIQIDPSVSTGTNIYLNPPNTQNVTALNAANGSQINMTGANGSAAITNPGGDANAPGFQSSSLNGFGSTHTGNTMSVDATHPVVEASGSGSAKNLTINTNSNCNINLVGDARAIVNAPNANVNIGAQQVLNKAANFYGAVVGGVTTIISDYTNGMGAYMHYDLNIKRSYNNGALVHSDPWAFLVPPPQNGAPIVQYRAVTWQEQ
jgi:hypothetical protein